MAMFRKLGAKLDYNNPSLHFPHTCNDSIRIFVLMDPVHMLKLVRNQLEAQDVLISVDDEKVEWDHIVQLHKLQTKYSASI